MQLMDRLVDFLMDNISNLTSARSIKNAFSSVQEKVNHVTISSYLQYLCNAFISYSPSCSSFSLFSIILFFSLLKMQIFVVLLFSLFMRSLFSS